MESVRIKIGKFGEVPNIGEGKFDRAVEIIIMNKIVEYNPILLLSKTTYAEGERIILKEGGHLKITLNSKFGFKNIWKFLKKIGKGISG